MSSSAYLIRLTQVYRYTADNVQLGAVFLNHKAGAHKIIVLTTQNKLNMEPRVGQQWEVFNEQNVSVRQQQSSFGGYINVWRFMEPKLKCVIPDNGAGFVSFLSSEKVFVGIGRVKAQLLWERFGKKLFTMLECARGAPFYEDISINNFEAIKDVLRQEHTVNALYDGFKEYANLKHASQLVEWEIEAPIQRQLFRMAGQDVSQYLQTNPYRLFSLGMRFQKVDDIAQKHFAVKFDDEVRLRAVVEQGLRLWSDKGNTVAEWHDIENSVSQNLKNSHQLTMKAKELEGDVLGFVKKDEQYFVSGNYIFEKTIAKRFIKLAANKHFWSNKLEEVYLSAIPDGWTLEIEQARAVRAALINEVFILTGGAGTGKTTTTKLIVDAYKKLKFKVYAVALSGKATRRLKQSIGMETSTIARLLREKNIPDTNCVLLIDEASMLDAYTMWRLVTLFSIKTRIILVGDPFQLPPINAGFILKDAINSKLINHVELDVNRRTGSTSSIPAYSAEIKDGKVPLLLSTEDITFQESTDSLIQDAANAYTELNNAMIVAPTNLTVRSVNIKLQDSVNASGEAIDLTDMPVTRGSYEFRKGDPVVITQTSYKDDVQNGTLGIIKDIIPTEEYACTIELEDFDLSGHKRLLKVDWNLFEYIDLAYCLTLHKLQGSQAECVIILLERGILLDRSWLYTAVTRAEKKVRIIGTKSDFLYGISKQGAFESRKTGLSKMLKNECI
jgi:exodeoxyribonuclease V alpha subunit